MFTEPICKQFDYGPNQAYGAVILCSASIRFFVEEADTRGRRFEWGAFVDDHCQRPKQKPFNGWGADCFSCDIVSGD